MTHAIRTLLALAAAAIVLVGCAPSAPRPKPRPELAPAEETATDAGGAAGMMLAPGLYETDQGTQALGTLRYRDVEGGFWVLSDDTATGGGANVVVLVGVEDLGVDLKALEGTYVSALGERLEGASMRNAGPEMTVSSIAEVGSDVIVGPADETSAP